MTQEVKPSLTEQFQSLAVISNLTGALHEAQASQLRLYGMACSQAVVLCTVGWDADKREIYYTLDVDKDKIEPDFAKRMTFLRHAAAAIMRGWQAKVRLRQYGTMTSDTAELLHDEPLSS
jgi:hypothetical protein